MEREGGPGSQAEGGCLLCCGAAGGGGRERLFTASPKPWRCSGARPQARVPVHMGVPLSRPLINFEREHEGHRPWERMVQGGRDQSPERMGAGLPVRAAAHVAITSCFLIWFGGLDSQADQGEKS